MQELIEKVNTWFEDSNPIQGSTDKDQVLKLMQELGELSDHACKGEDIRDDLGDMLVVMLNIMKRNNSSQWKNVCKLHTMISKTEKEKW